MATDGTDDTKYVGGKGRLRIAEAIVVEGRYDKGKLVTIVDAVIIETDGFALFTDGAKLDLIRRYAAGDGIIILTDSDRAGFRIRRHIRGSIAGGRILHAYIPDVLGKERRKPHPSKEGKLGVEGVDKKLIIGAILASGATVIGDLEALPKSAWMTNSRLYADGISGGEGSSSRRRRLLEALGLPARLSTAGLIDVLNTSFTEGDYEAALKSVLESKESSKDG